RICRLSRHRRGGSRPRRSHCWRILGCAVALVSLLGGCAGYEQRPEINPDAFAPPKVGHEWAPSPAAGFNLASELGSVAQEPPVERGRKYALADLADLALSRNPETRRTWETARAAAAESGRTQAPYYPVMSLDSENGYRRIADLVPKHWGVQ